MGFQLAARSRPHHGLRDIDSPTKSPRRSQGGHLEAMSDVDTNPPTTEEVDRVRERMLANLEDRMSEPQSVHHRPQRIRSRRATGASCSSSTTASRTSARKTSSAWPSCTSKPPTAPSATTFPTRHAGAHRRAGSAGSRLDAVELQEQRHRRARRVVRPHARQHRRRGWRASTLANGMKVVDSDQGDHGQHGHGRDRTALRRRGVARRLKPPRRGLPKA